MEYKLSDLFALQMGKTPARDEPRYWQNGRHSWISIADLSSVDKFIEETKESISDCAVKESNISMIPKGTVVMSFKLSLGKVAITKKAMYSNEAIMAFIPRAGVDISTDYLYYLLKARKWDTGGNKAVKGVTLNKATLSSVKVCIHSDEEQRLIVNILDKLKSVIKRRQSQLAKLDELGKCRFVEMFGDIELNYKLEDLCSLITDGTHQPPQFTDSGIPFLLVSNIKQNYINYETYKFIDEQTYRHLIKRTPVETGDLLLSTVGSYGHPAIVQGTQRFCFQRHIAFLKPIRERVNSVYLHQAILSDNVQEQIEKSVLGVAQKTLNLSAIRRLVIPYPPIEKQNSFASFVHRIDKLRIDVQAALDKAQTLFDSLMQEYFG